MNEISCKQSLADFCLYYVWGTTMMLWLLQIDNCTHCEKKDEVDKCKENLMSKLDHKGVGGLEECVGCKLEHKGMQIKLNQLALAQSLKDKFGIPGNISYLLLALANKELTSKGEPLLGEEKKVCRSGVDELLFLMRYS